MGQISPDVEEIIRIAENLCSEYANQDLAWIESPFAWMKLLPSRTVGKIGERLVASWFTAQNFDVSLSPNSDADRIINGLRVEIKLSTLWKPGMYKFQQLRDQAYDIVICLGISPYDVHCWVLSKKLILEKWKAGEIKSQHKGSKGQDTAWLEVHPNSPQAWLTPTSGRLAETTQILRELTKE